jgi:hypothetical protein
MARLRRGEVAVRGGDDLQVGDRRPDQELREVVFAPCDEVREAAGRLRDAEAGVQIRALEVAVDGDHALAAAGQHHTQVGHQEALADPALAAAHRDHPRRRGITRTRCNRCGHVI